jgi:hypothetical protein
MGGHRGAAHLEKAAYEQLVHDLARGRQLGGGGELAAESCLAWASSCGQRTVRLPPGLTVAGGRMRSLHAFVSLPRWRYRLQPHRPTSTPCDEVLVLGPGSTLSTPAAGAAQTILSDRPRPPAGGAGAGQRLPQRRQAIGEDGASTSRWRARRASELRVADSGAASPRTPRPDCSSPLLHQARRPRPRPGAIREVVGQHGFGCGLANRPRSRVRAALLAARKGRHVGPSASVAR